MPFPIGWEGEITTIVDKVRLPPRLEKSKVVTADAIVLHLPADDYSNMFELGRVISDYENAIKAGDPDGIDVLVQKGLALRIQNGTKVRVIKVFPKATTSDCSGLPCDGSGARNVRVTSGDFKGRVVFVPARYLRPVQQKADQTP